MSREIDIKSIKSRPRFKIKTFLSKDEFTDKLRKHFEQNNKVLGGYIGEEISVIRLRKDKEKYWAPQLQIRSEMDEDNEKITNIRGVFGPRPAVWTFFMFLYMLGSTIVLFFGMIWIVQISLKNPSNLIHWIWVGVAILIGTYIASKVGQTISKEHISVLRNFMEKVVKDELEEDGPIENL